MLPFNFFFFYFLSSFICCLLIRMIASQASCFLFQKKKKFQSSPQSSQALFSFNPPFFELLSCLLIRMVDSRASCFLLKNFFRHIHEHCCYLTLFCFSDTFGFLVNGSWSHDKLSAPYFVPCCTENISMIEMDHSLHRYHWMHFTKRLWEKVPTTTRHKYYCSFTKPDQFFFRRNWDSFFLLVFDMGTLPRKKFLI